MTNHDGHNPATDTAHHQTADEHDEHDEHNEPMPWHAQIIRDALDEAARRHDDQAHPTAAG